MKTILGTILILLFGSAISAQNRNKIYDGCLEIRKYYAFKDDVITFQCDTVLLLNLNTYRVLDSAYSHLYKMSNALVAKTESANVLLIKQYDEKSRAYDALDIEFSKFRDVTRGHIDSISSDMKKVKDKMINAKSKLDSTDAYISTSMMKIEDSQKKQFWKNIKYGAIGFALATVVFLAAK